MHSQPQDDTQTDDLELLRRNIHLTRRAVKPLGRQQAACARIARVGKDPSTSCAPAMIVLERRWSEISTRRYQIVSSRSVLVDVPIKATSTVESGGPEAVNRVQRGRVIKNHRRRGEKWELGGSPLRTVQ